MARDPKLKRFAGPNARLFEARQSCIGLPVKAGRSSAPWQHPLKEVLHFVCELRGPIAPVQVALRQGPFQVLLRYGFPADVAEYGFRLRGHDRSPYSSHSFNHLQLLPGLRWPLSVVPPRRPNDVNLKLL